MLDWVAGVASKIVASAVWDGAKGIFKRSKENSPSSLSLNLNGAMPYNQPMAAGIGRAAERTLAEITEALSESSMEWLHEKDFGNSFRWKMVKFLETFTWQPQVPAREFLDSELESLRVELVAAAKNFMHLAAAYTDDLHPASDDDIRKIPDLGAC